MAQAVDTSDDLSAFTVGSSQATNAVILPVMDLPVELRFHILTISANQKNLMMVSRFFYEAITGFRSFIELEDQDGSTVTHARSILGIECQPNHQRYVNNLKLSAAGREAFLDAENVPDKVPGFIWYTLLEKYMVTGQRYLEQFQGTRLKIIHFFGTNIGEAALDLGIKIAESQIENAILHGCLLGPDYASEFVKNVAGSSIRTIKLSLNNIKIRGVIGIVKALKGSQVTVLDLSNNLIDPKHLITPPQLNPHNLLQYLINRPQQEENDWPLFKEKMAEFSEHLQATPIKELNLSLNLIGIEGAIILLQKSQNGSLEKLSLSSCGLRGSNDKDDDGETALSKFAKALAATSIKEIDLTHNGIDDTGARTLKIELKDKGERRIILKSNLLSGDLISEFLNKNGEGQLTWEF